MESCETSTWEGILLILSLPIAVVIGVGGLAWVFSAIDRKYPW